MGEMELVHTVTGIRTERHLSVKGNPYEAVDARCFGWYPSLEEAMSAAASNACDINEAGHYPWLVVESVPPGVYAGGMVDEEHWYRWAQDGEYAGEGSYEPCEPPEGVAATADGIRFCSFGMG